MKLAGRVVVKESNQGVANLLVVAYDAGGDTALQLLKSVVTDHGSDAFGRLASVLTDDQGAFSMVGDDLTVPGHAGRPNLLVVVFAPEDVQSSSRPYPLPQEKRILYLSAVPRTAASFVFCRNRSTSLGSLNRTARPPVMSASSASHPW